MDYGKPKREWTDNEAIAMMHRNTRNILRDIADFIFKHEMDYEETSEYLREIADEMDAQAMVVELRDNQSKPLK